MTKTPTPSTDRRTTPSAYYSAEVKDFLAASPEEILGSMTSHGQFALEIEQRNAWEVQRCGVSPAFYRISGVAKVQKKWSGGGRWRIGNPKGSGGSGDCPTLGSVEKFQSDPHWRDHLLFHEYFHADTGAGLGANHQTDWTALVASLIDEWRK